MSDNIIALKIDRLAGLGDGVGMHDGRKVFVPYTAAGDVVRARITKRTSDADYARLLEIITPGTERIAPVCAHFGTCGGCTLQHIADDMYAGFKHTMAREAVRKAGFDPACVAPLARLPAGSRRRAELKAAEGKLGFYAEGSHSIVDIGECKVLEPALFALIMALKPQLIHAPGTIRLQVNGVDGGYDLLLEGDVTLAPQASPDIKRISERQDDTIRTVYQSGPVTLTLGGITVEVPPGAFLQASRAAQTLMTDLVVQAVANRSQLLDLFAGIGTYSFPLTAFASVTAVEGEQSMVDAMQQASSGNILKAVQRDLFLRPYTAAELKAYDAVIINPPRAGAKAQVEQLAASSIAHIVMVSCNPATFTRDARILREGGYDLRRLTPVDQFVYSSHLELVAEFIR